MERFEKEIKKEVDDFLKRNIRFTHEEGERIRDRIAPKEKRAIRFNPVYWTVLAAAASLFIFISISFINNPNGISIGNTTLLGFMNGEDQHNSLYKGKYLKIGVIGAIPEVNEKQIAFQEISFDQFTIEEVRNFDAVFVMKESLSTAAEKQYTKIFTDSHIPFFFIDSNKGAYPFIDENLEYEEAAEIPNHNYFATGYLLTIDGEEMTWTYEPSNENNKVSFSAIFKTIEYVTRITFNGNEDITDEDLTISIGADAIIFYGEGAHWNVRYIYNPEMYDEKKVNWVEIELQDSELSLEDLNNIDIEFEGRDGVITGNVGGMVTKIKDNVISFLVGTVNNETYKEDKYKIKIKFNDQQDVIRLKFLSKGSNNNEYEKEDITSMDDSKISDGNDLTLVLEQSGREDIHLKIEKLPVLLSYLTQSDDLELEMSRLQSTFILTHQDKDYFLVSFNCGVKLCDQLLVEHSSKDEVQSIVVSESSLLQDVKLQEDHLALLFGRNEGVAVVRNQVALLNVKEFIKVSPPPQLEVLESFEYPIARIEWKNNALKAAIADLEEPTFENIVEWNKNNGEPIQELLWEFK
ncbi:hypothetical protein QTL97_15630 [Sporosarcina thermotolerans]|uniref:DUF4179 domain-containing protein n=1 Tax=Sporosarcina thermotolerans TaxID=633404 RepID=A0AAW9AA65_9BACL|nr:hypothetical protein [Sporosarcina thermotolerans]MDW0118362.1 hypothetical protein [Sporosarcina thermotolerans]